MRTIIDLPEHHIEQLALLSQEKKLSRAELIRQAVEAYLRDRSTSSSDVFGLWKEHKVDGLTYQNKLRDEWK
ncbi:MAG TPA: ribbon-helix-helix protein, CopG family [Thiothrix sp.]|nr:ribbon-helix-helix protein, CopG family [Thiothrix sp.]